MSGRGLWNLAVGTGLDGVDEIRELYGVLNEEDGNIVSHNVKVALIRVADSLAAPSHEE